MRIDRKQEVPIDGPMSDLLWSDPDDVKGWIKSPRGAGWIFGKEPTKKFCHDNNVDSIVRAHQVVMEGWKSFFDDRLVTVWSAPNYCGRTGILASIMELDENLEKMYKIFEATPFEERDALTSNFPLSRYIF